MRHLFCAVLTGWLTLGLVSCNDSSQASSQDKSETPHENTQKGDNVLTEKEINEGWKSLFDGKTTNGWHTFKEDGVSPGWKAIDGMLVFTPSDEKGNGGDLLTNAQYENFHLKVDWKISDCGNSGIMFNVQEDGREKTYHTGPEMQILDNTCHGDAKYLNHRAGSLYDLIQALPETVKPAGEWNTAEIIINDGHLIFKLNGSQVVETQMFNDEWDKMLANSKFKQWPGFGTYRKGHIAFQDHGDVVSFKNIMIKEL